MDVRQTAGLVTGALALVMAAAGALEAQAPDPAGPVPAARVVAGTLSFDGHATAGDFTGSTDSVSGGIRGADSLAAVAGCVRAPVQTLITGNDHRDRDLNKSMESQRYPDIRFQLHRVEWDGAAADTAAIGLVGDLTLHGVSHAVTLPATLVRRSDSLLVATDFPVNLKDYQIGGLSKFFGLFKMDEHITVHVRLLFLAAPGYQPDCAQEP